LAERTVDLLITNGVLVTMDGRQTVLDGASLAVQDGVIVGVGADLDVAAKRTIDARGNAVLPGFVDAHMHECLLRGYAEDMPLMQWLERICFPKDRAYEPHHMRAAALMGQLEMIQGGITTFIDIFRYPAQAAQVAEASGLRAIFSPQIIESTPGAGETVESSEAFVREWRDRVPGRIFAWFGPHAPYSVSPEGYRRIRELADRYEVGIHTHLCETAGEVELIQNQYGCSPVEHLDRLGVLGPDCLAAHCVHLSERDVELLVERDVAVAYNPASNMKLASGVAPVPWLLEAGVRVGLGTDSNLSNNNLDMFEDMRLGAMLQKLHREDAAALPAQQVLEMATLGGARCLGLQDQVGSLEVGKRADVVVVDLHTAHMWPALHGQDSNLVEQLVYSANANDVLTTIVDGKVLMEDRQVITLDPVEIEDTVRRAAEDLIEKGGIRSARLQSV
jgi:5-methylthioadenosine/S-adenosylhomocysteine deaminase